MSLFVACSDRPSTPPQDEILGPFIRSLPPEFEGWRLIPSSGGGTPLGSTFSFRIKLSDKSEKEIISELKNYIADRIRESGADLVGGGTNSPNGNLRSFSFRVSNSRSAGTVAVSTYPIDNKEILAVVAVAQVGVPEF